MKVEIQSFFIRQRKPRKQQLRNLTPFPKSQNKVFLQNSFHKIRLEPDFTYPQHSSAHVYNFFLLNNEIVVFRNLLWLTLMAFWLDNIFNFCCFTTQYFWIARKFLTFCIKLSLILAFAFREPLASSTVWAHFHCRVDRPEEKQGASI